MNIANRSSRIEISGKVQGIGFRPFVYNLAIALNLKGFVQNNGSGVIIEISGDAGAVTEFCTKIQSNELESARIETFNVRDILEDEYGDFSILESGQDFGGPLSLAIDEGICQDCLVDLWNPENRRYLHPFISCSKCGPRYSIQYSIPYDRKNSSMESFALCDTCLREYRDPRDRRFFAQTICCKNCGPNIYDLQGNAANRRDPIELIESISEKILNGGVGIIKGIGGFHLFGRADDAGVVGRIRTIKHREKKPLAVMLKRKDYFGVLGKVSNIEKQTISGVSPVTIVKNDRKIQVAHNVTFGLNEVGFLLPYTGLHEILMQRIQVPIVMTSANISGDPIIYEEETILKKFSKSLDFILSHDRKIVNSIDDTVVKKNGEGFNFIRPGRGAYPHCRKIFSEFENTLLATGSDLKSTFAFGRSSHVFLSPYCGDLDNPDAQNEYLKRLEATEKNFNLQNGIIVSDLHPDFYSKEIANRKSAENKCKSILVQHHHAHVASCMAENQIQEPVIGIALDGTGFGTDTSIWGGEVLIADYGNFIHAGGLKKNPIYGGDVSVKEPFRYAMSLLFSSGIALEEICKFYGNIIPENLLKNILIQIKNKINFAETSSCGRFFDALSSILGICHYSSYDGETAVLLEEAAKKYFLQNSENRKLYEIQKVKFEESKNFFYGRKKKIFSEIDLRRLIRFAFENTEVDRSKIAYIVHLEIAEAFSEVVKNLSLETGIKKVVLSGGCFMNSILLSLLKNKMESDGLVVITHSEIPCNDSGISFGQAVVGNFVTSGRKSCVLQYL